MACSYLCAWESSAPPTQLLGFSPISRPPWTPYEPYYSPRLNRPPALPPRLKEAEHALSEYVNRSKALVPALLIWRSYSLLPSKWVGSTDSFGSPCTFPPSSTPPGVHGSLMAVLLACPTISTKFNWSQHSLDHVWQPANPHCKLDRTSVTKRLAFGLADQT